MNVRTTGLEGVVVLEPKVFKDSRGFFTESYSRRTFEALGMPFDFVQDNHSRSVEAGTLRGLHYQMNPKSQAKLVRVLSGAAFDVVVDIRKGSPTYGKWVSEILTSENFQMIIVPKGFAHGILTLVPHTEIFYKVDEFYSPAEDRGIRWDDPEIAVRWPWRSPILSEKDQKAPLLKDAQNNFTYGG